jgi:hypothetical protein
MSNYLAVAAVTASLKKVLDEALTAGVPGAVANATVTTTRPETAGNGGSDRKGINVYLYQVTPNASWRNADLPTRRGDGTLVQRPQAALNLHYLLTFYGDEANLEPQRLLGMTVRTVNARPVLTRDAIRAAVDAATVDDPATYLQFSDLADAIELVKFSPLPLNLEELSKLWSVFFQTPYVLSVAYEGSVVLIESEESPHSPGLPVLDRRVRVLPFRAPTIDEIVPAGGRTAPVLSGSSVRIRGQNLLGDDTRVRIGPAELPAPGTSTPQEIAVSLPASLQAGVHAVQVVQFIDMGEPPSPHRGFESNVAPLVLRPLVVPPVSATAGDAGEFEVKVEVAPKVGRRQRVVLLLDELDPPADGPLHSYRFELPPRDEGAPDESSFATFATSGVEDGDYLVRVQVDGAESPLDLGAQGTFDGPTVSIG